MKKTALLICILLSGCAASVLSSTPRSVVIKAGSTQGAAAQTLAEAECQKYGHHARLNGKLSEMQWVFDCVQ